jgi:hypothetical protein
LEFHLPYFVLREHASPIKDDRKLRRCGPFLADRQAPSPREYLYEAKTSCLITGIDEWVWTTYFCTEKYFEGKNDIEIHHNGKMDAPTGGDKLKQFPFWNPRGYFLFIFRRRFREAVTEWSIIVHALDERLQIHVLFSRLPESTLGL